MSGNVEFKKRKGKYKTWNIRNRFLLNKIGLVWVGGFCFNEMYFNLRGCYQVYIYQLGM